MPDSNSHNVISHSTGIPGVNAFTLASQHTFPRHSHDQYGVGFIVNGAQKSWSGRGQVEATAGDLITTNPGEVHDGEPLSEYGRQWRMIYLDPSEFLGTLVGEELHRSQELVHPVVRKVPLANQFLTTYRELSNPASSIESRQEQMVLLTWMLFQELGEQPARTSLASPDLTAVVEFLHDASSAPHSLSELASLVDLSRFQLIRAFKAQLGITPYAYLSQLRVNHARRLISQGASMADAAQIAGFSDQSHMSRAFRCQLGTTPGNWRCTLPN